MKLSKRYELGNKEFYVISCHDDESIVLLDFTFDTLERAQEHLKKAEQQGCQLQQPKILTAQLTGIVQLVPKIKPIDGEE